MIGSIYNVDVHPSWLELVPIKKAEGYKCKNEDIEEYLHRIGHGFKNIPESVLRQWLYLHTINPDMINNYGWIDYHKATFVEMLWTDEQISQIQVFSRYRPYVESRSKIEQLSDFMCIRKDKDYWAKYGTWRIPIVVLKTVSIYGKPNRSELNKPYQLIEGHSRIGYFRAFCRFREEYIKNEKLHKIYLMHTNQT